MERDTRQKFTSAAPAQEVMRAMRARIATTACIAPNWVELVASVNDERLNGHL
jgi:hypothetical protein